MSPLGGQQQTTAGQTTSQPSSSQTTSGQQPGQQQRQLQFTTRELRMEGMANAGPINNSNNGGNGNQQQPSSSSGQSPQQQPSQQQPQYSIPGILHFLQYEWQRFEVERQQWNVERAELQARIALLQGERKGQENLKNDLVRRIKMLEYCLKQERIKFHRLKFGTDPPGFTSEAADEDMNDVNDADPLAGLMSNNNNNNLDDATAGLNWKHGRQLLRQYLQEIGYTDTIIDVRSNRVRSLLGLNNNMNKNNAVNAVLGFDGSEEGLKGMKGSTSTQVRRNNSSGAAASVVGETEASVLATFDFLHDQRDGSSRDDDEEDDEEDIVDDEAGTGAGGEKYGMDSETEEVLAEFDFLNTQQQQSGKHHHIQQQQQQQDANWRSRIPDIGELANLTLNNDADMNGSEGGSVLSSGAGLPVTGADYRKTWNPKYILKSHFDCIRSLRFHPLEPLLVTCSEDETLKVWNLNKTQTTSTKSGKSNQSQSQSGQQPSSAATTFDLEPVHTFRGHTSRVLSLNLEENVIFSGSQSGELFSWRLPENMSNIDPYDSFDVSMAPTSFVGHSDAIWSLVTKESKSGSQLLVSAAADATVKVWDVNRRECVTSIDIKDVRVRPTCIFSISSSNSSAASSSGSLIVVSFTDGSMSVFDLESNEPQTPVLSFETNASGNELVSRINSVVVHPTLPVVVSAHEDRQIKFWDLNNGLLILLNLMLVTF